LVTIILGDLKKEASEISTFIQEKTSLKVEYSGENMDIQSEQENKVSTRHLKVYLKRFLHNRGIRKNYRVFVNKDEISIIKRPDEEEEE